MRRPYTSRTFHRRGVGVSEPDNSVVTDTAGTQGAADAGPAPQTDLRTFLIADIRGYTTYTREHGDQAAANLVNRFGQIVSEVAAAWDGFLLEMRGDEALVAFVSARKALRAAVDMQGRFADDKLPRGVGIGLDAGEAIPVGDGYRGTSLNLAARLCSQAAAGETLASEAVMHLAAKIDGIAYVDARDLKLKGYTQSVRAVVVLPSERAKGHRLATDRRSLARSRAAAVGLITVAALAVVTALLGTYLLNGRPQATPTPGPTALANATPTAGRTTVSPTANASPDPLGGAKLPTLAFYNSATGNLEATAGLESPRNISFFAGGSFWILTENPNAFNRVDAQRHTVVQTINVPPVEPHGFAFDDDYIWVTDLGSPQVYRIDQRSGAWTTFNFGTEADMTPAGDVTVGDGSVWLSRDQHDPPEITRIDRQTGAVQAQVEVTVFGLSYGADALWYWHGGFIGRIDPATNASSFDDVELSNDSYLGNIYFAGGDAWTDSTGTGKVYRVDQFGRYKTYDLEPGIADMAPAADAMWVTNFNTGELTGIDLGTGQADSKIRTGHAVVAVASSGEEVMLAVTPTTNEVVAALYGTVLTLGADGIPWWDPAPDPPVAGNSQVQQLLDL